MAIPIASFVAPTIAPTDSPVESLDSVIQADIAGIKAGQALPTVLGAVAEGVGAGLDSYREAAAFETKQELQQAQIEAYKAQANRVSPTAIKAEQERALALKRQQIGAVIDSGNKEAVNQILTSGQFSDVLSDPKFAQAVFRSATARDLLYPQTKQAFLDAENKSRAKSFEDRLAETRTIKYVDALGKWTGSDYPSLIKEQTQGMSDYDILKHGKMVPKGTYTVDETGRIQVDDTLKPVVNETTGEKSYDFVDTRSNRVLASNLPEDAKKKFDNVRGSAYGVPDAFLDDGPITSGVKEGQGTEPNKQPKSKFAPEQLLQSRDTTPSPVAAKQAVRQTKPINPQTGQIDVINNPVYFVGLAKTLGLPGARGTDYNLNGEFSTLLGAAAKGGIANTPDDNFKNMLVTAYQDAADKVIKTSLSEQYRTNQSSRVFQLQYNDAAVKEHNKRVKATIDMIENAGTSTTRLPGPIVNNPFELVEATSPEDLYVIQNYASASQSLRSYLQTIESQVAKENMNALNTGEATKRFAAKVNSLR